MEMSKLRSVFDHDGPFATIYLEGRAAPSEDAPTQVRLRWKSLRERLADAGADSGTLDTLERTVYAEQPGEVQANGRVLVANHDGILLDTAWDAAVGSGDAAHWSADPEFGALLRERATLVRLLVVVANQKGATVRRELVAREHTNTELDESSVTGSSIVGGVHKPRGNALSHNRIQRRADEAVARNAKDIVQYVGNVARTFVPRVLVLAGETKGRAAIREELTYDLARLLVETDRGGTDDHSAEETLADELRRIASETSAADAAAWGEKFSESKAHDRAAEGAEKVVQAAGRGIVASLLLGYDRRTPDEANIVRSCVRGGSDIGLLPDGGLATPDIAAILRTPLPSNDERK